MNAKTTLAPDPSHQVYNLDDEQGREAFLKRVAGTRGVAAAWLLGFKGPGYVKAANAMVNYVGRSIQLKRVFSQASVRIVTRAKDGAFDCIPPHLRWR